MKKDKSFIKKHPCFSVEAHHKFGRVHLPVAPACNIQCKYCVRKFDCANESRPGVSSTVLKPWEAVERVRSLVDRNEKLSVIGIAGPGDPLANDSTFEVMSAINREYPEVILCVSTNGLYLPKRLPDIISAGVKSLTVTINAVLPETAERVYSWASYEGKRLSGMDAAERILYNQWQGLRAAVAEGLVVKVNTVFIPGVNEGEIPLIAWQAGRHGAEIMNIMPLIPQAEFAHLQRPSREDIARLRSECGGSINQMSHCRQCRADACGLLGEEKDAELEVLQARIGEEYCEMVV